MTFGRFTVVAALAALAPAIPVRGALSLQPVVTSGLSQPLYVTAAPGDANRLFIVEKTGAVRLFDRTTNTLQTSPYLSVPVSTTSERGLLGLAFAPDFATSGNFYVAYTRTGTAAETGDIIIARGSAVGANKLTSTSATLSSTPLLTIEHSSQGNHNGGWLGFSPKNNNNLYIAVGDGGSGNDPNGNAQNTNVLLGKMLRIGVNGTDSYTIPAGNPFASSGGAPEVWAYGLRNPWRNGFDRTTGALYIGDVGQSAREEVDYQPDGELAAGQGGKNYGWRRFEGNILTPGISDTSPDASAVTFPINEYDRTIGRAITGGYAYRGTLLGPGFQGTYFFGDSEVGKFFTLNYDGVIAPIRLDRTDEIDPAIAGSRLFGSDSLVSFGEDSAGELYVVDIAGQVYRIIPEPASLSLLVLPALLLRRRYDCRARRRPPRDYCWRLRYSVVSTPA